MASRSKSAQCAETRALVRMALKDGWTQADLAKKARTQQSTVSRWANGKGLATEAQLAFLMESYGHRLNRYSAAVYRVVGPRSCAWEDSDEGQLWSSILRLREERKGASARTDDMLEVTGEEGIYLDEELAELFFGIPPSYENWHSLVPIGQLRNALEAEYNTAAWSTVVVEGVRVFQHTFEVPSRREPRSRSASPTLGWRAVRRWVVHRAGPRHFRLARLEVARLQGRDREQWLHQAWKTLYPTSRNRNLRSPFDAPAGAFEDTLYSREESGRWHAKIEGPYTLDKLVARCDDLVCEDGGSHDAQAVPFLLRRALLTHGHQLPDVERFGPTQDLQ